MIKKCTYVEQLNDVDLYNALKSFGYSPGPIVGKIN